MNLRMHTKYISLLFLLLSLSSCFFNDSEKDQGELIYVVEPQTEECTIDADRLSKIMTENVVEEIACVEYQLNQFAKFVEREESEYINRLELAKFIRKFFKENNPEKLVKSLELLFDFSNLLFEDRKDRISLKNIAPLSQLFKNFNIEAIKINKLIGGPEDFQVSPEREELPFICQYVPSGINSDADCHDIYLAKKKRYNISINKLQKAFLDTVYGKKRYIDQIDMIDYAVKINNAFNEGKTQKSDMSDVIDINLLKGFLYVKRIFLGGDKQKLATDELIDLFYKVPYFSNALFDLKYASEEVFEKLPNERSHTFLNLVTRLPNVVHNSFLSSEVIFTIQEIINSLNSLSRYERENQDPDDPEEDFDNINYQNFKDVFEMVKGKIFIGDKDKFIYSDITYIIEQIRFIYEGIYFY